MNERRVRKSWWSACLLVPALAGCGGDLPTLETQSRVLEIGRTVQAVVPGTEPGQVLVGCVEPPMIAAVHAAKASVTQRLPVKPGPSALIRDAAGGYVFCLHRGQNAISVLTGDPLRVVRSVPTGNLTLAGGAMRPGRSELWICDGVSAVYIFTTPDLQLRRRMILGRFPQYIAFSPGGDTAWVTLKGENAVAQVDAASGQELARVPVGVFPWGILLTNGLGVISNEGSNDISLIDIEHGGELARIPARKKPKALALDGDRVWVACQGAYRILRLDLNTRCVDASIYTGFYPKDLCLLPDRTLAVTDPKGRLVLYALPKP